MLKSRLINKFRTLVIVSIIICPSLPHAADVVSVQSISIAPYNEAFKGVADSCSCKIKQFVLSEMRGVNAAESVRRERPDAIVAIGMGALKKVREIKNIPVVYLMVLNAKAAVSGGDNIAGIRMNVAPEKQLSLIKEALPGIKTLGLLYNPAQTGAFVKAVLAASLEKGIKVSAKEVDNIMEVSGQLDAIGEDADVFWMLPDVSIIAPETVEMIFLYSLRNRVPVVTFSGKYLQMGALMSLDVDPYDMGLQAARMVGKILSGTGVNMIRDENARKVNITINDRTAKKLGLSVSDEILKKAKVINQ